MTDMGNSDLRPQAVPQQAAAKSWRSGMFGWRRLAVAAVAVTVVGAGGLALAGAGDATARPDWMPRPRLEMIQRIAVMALDSVGATAAQEAKVHDIIAANFADLAPPDAAQRAALRKQAFDLLRAPAIDRAAAEKLRAEAVARFDAKSKKLLGALLDAAAELTPEQRGKLADRAEAMAQRGPMMGGPGGFWGAPGRRPMLDDGFGDADGLDAGPVSRQNGR